MYRVMIVLFQIGCGWFVDEERKVLVCGVNPQQYNIL